MKNIFLAIVLIVLAFTYNSSLHARVLPIIEEVELIDDLDLQIVDMNEFPELFVGINKEIGLPYSYNIDKQFIEIRKNLIYGTFLFTTSVINLKVGIDSLPLNEECKIIRQDIHARIP